MEQLAIPLAVVAGLLLIVGLLIWVALRSYRRESSSAANLQQSQESVDAWVRFAKGFSDRRDLRRALKLRRLLDEARRRRAADGLPTDDGTGGTGADGHGAAGQLPERPGVPTR